MRDLGTTPLNRAAGPSFLTICWKQSTMPRYTGSPGLRATWSLVLITVRRRKSREMKGAGKGESVNEQILSKKRYHSLHPEAQNEFNPTISRGNSRCSNNTSNKSCAQNDRERSLSVLIRALKLEERVQREKQNREWDISIRSERKENG